ncbi:MAG: hypothetical protein ACK2TV_09710, partial [Anaerolineales bacterium]
LADQVPQEPPDLMDFATEEDESIQTLQPEWEPEVLEGEIKPEEMEPQGIAQPQNETEVQPEEARIELDNEPDIESDVDSDIEPPISMHGIEGEIELEEKGMLDDALGDVDQLEIDSNLEEDVEEEDSPPIEKEDQSQDDQVF